MPVAGQVEKDRPLLARIVCRLRSLKRPVNCVRRFGRGENAFAAREEDRGGEDVVLGVRLRADQIVAHEL